ncbi:hypothetical protein K402DRAFT_401176 [Aulographum hederae CBS 113979]|uniref:Uncharacterized protein n=1 Tax=Aulographum hederae CBS 113979 TaxID=1176131 RepID=A0A6G1HAS0_9PEZI|nr:hypothetical protein K402DRAFT_401176 [Aulographum hederae CBS 113979]
MTAIRQPVTLWGAGGSKRSRLTGHGGRVEAGNSQASSLFQCKLRPHNGNRRRVEVILPCLWPAICQCHLLLLDAPAGHARPEMRRAVVHTRERADGGQWLLEHCSRAAGRRDAGHCGQEEVKGQSMSNDSRLQMADWVQYHILSGGETRFTGLDSSTLVLLVATRVCRSLQRVDWAGVAVEEPAPHCPQAKRKFGNFGRGWRFVHLASWSGDWLSMAAALSKEDADRGGSARGQSPEPELEPFCQPAPALGPGLLPPVSR